MGKYDSLRAAVSGGSTNVGDTSTPQKSKYDSLKMSMGLIEDTRPKTVQPTLEQNIAAGKAPRLNILETPLMKQVNSQPVKTEAPEKPKAATKKSKGGIPVLDYLNDKLGGVVEGISNFGNRAAVSATDTMSLGQGKRVIQNDTSAIGDIFRENSSPADTKAEHIADVLGNLYGFTLPGVGAYGTGGKLFANALKEIAPNAPKIVNAAVRGTGAGLTYGSAKEGLDAIVGPERKTPAERLKNIALETALFAGGDAAFSAAGSGIRAMSQKAKTIANDLGENAIKTVADNSRTAVKSPFSQEAAFNNPVAKKYTESVSKTFNREPLGASNVEPRPAKPPTQPEVINTSPRAALETLNPITKSNAAPLSQGELDDLIRVIQEDTVTGPKPAEPSSKPLAEISQPNNPDNILQAAAKALKDEQRLGVSAFGKRAGEYDNLSTDTKSQLVSKTAREPISLRDTADSGYRKMVDDMHRFKDFDKAAEKILGRKLAPSEQTHTLALNSRGSDMITKHILMDDLVDINGNVVGRSLKNAMQQVPKGKMVDFEDYQVLKHGMFRMKRGEKVYHDGLEMTADKAAQKVAEYENQFPEFKTIADELYDFRKNLTKTWLVDSGLVSRNNWDGILENNPFYTPNNRQFSNTEKGMSGGRAKKGFARQSSPLKQAPGSERKIISPTESDIEHVDQYVKAGKRNQVMQTFVKTIKKDPESFEGFAEIMPMTDNMKQAELKRINEILEKDGVEGLVMNMNEKFDDLFNAAKVAGRKDLDNTLPVLFDGEPVLIKVHDAPLLEAMTSLTPQAQGVIVEAARQVTRVMKMLTTGLNPVFSLTRNLIRDIPMAYVASKTTNNPLRFAFDLLDSTVSILGNKQMYKSFKSIGGGHSSAIAADRNMLAQSKRALLPQNKIKGVPGRLLGSVENFTNALETAPRLGEYKRLTKAGNKSVDSKIQGLFEANDVTVNFKKRGNVGREIDAFMPYFNAAIQGLDKTIRTFADKPVAATLKAVSAITVPSLILYAINHNDPDYKKLDDRTKDLFYLIPNGDGTFQKYPKPREGGAVFGSLVERALRKWKDEDPDAFRGYMENVRVAFTPPGLAGLTKPGTMTEKLEAGLIGDTILGPLSDLKSNKDFAERPIVPRYMDGLSPELQYDERTSELSKWIGEKIHQSPKQLDYLLKSYTGIIGQLGIPLNSEGGSIMKALKQQVTADPTYSNNVFTDFYDVKDKVDTAHKNYSNTGEVPKDIDEPVRKFLNRASDQISKVRTAMREVQKDKSLSQKTKEQKLKELQILMTSIAEDANETIKNSK